MNQTRKKWIEAAISFQENPNAVIKCAECRKGTLELVDIVIDGLKDRYIRCNSCGKYEVVTKLKN